MSFRVPKTKLGMSSYKVLNNQIFYHFNYKIVPIRKIDRYDIMKWRNNQLFHLRQVEKLTKESQDLYFNNIISKQFDEQNPDQILFSYICKNKCIGYGGLVHINWIDKHAELSFVLNDQHVSNKETYKNEFNVFIKLILEVGFGELNLNKIITETFDVRSFHLSILESNGFEIEGRMKDHILINGSYVDSLIHAFHKKNYNA